MANYNDLFNSGDIPTQQTTGFGLPTDQIITETPNLPKLEVLQPPPMQDLRDGTEPMGLNWKTILVVVGCATVLYLLIVGLPDKPTSSSGVVSNPVSDTLNSYLGSDKNTNVAINNYSVDLSKLKSDGEVLFWVNYRKEFRLSEYHVVEYAVVCDSPQLGKFNFLLTHTQFTQIPDSGILPVVATQINYGDESDVYYTAFRLHTDWKKLLNGNVN